MIVFDAAKQKKKSTQCQMINAEVQKKIKNREKF